MASAAGAPEEYNSDSSLSPIGSPRPISVPPSNPTEILQDEYAKFKRENRRSGFNVKLSLSKPSCSRDDFYFALRAMDKFDPSGSMQLIEKCAESVGNPADPVDAATRCYSILIRNLYAAKERTLADVVVCDFLRGETTEDYLIIKNKVLYLILTDPVAYDAAPQEIKDEIISRLSDRSSYLHFLVLNTKNPNSPDVVRANKILSDNQLDIISSPETGGRKLKLKLRSKSRSSKNKNKKSNKNKNKKKTLRLRIKK